MDYLMAFLFPPLYFLVKGKWIALTISTILFVIGLALFWTIVIPFLFYIPCVIVAMYDAQQQLLRRHATDIANKIVEKQGP